MQPVDIVKKFINGKKENNDYNCPNDVRQLIKHYNEEAPFLSYQKDSFDRTHWMIQFLESVRDFGMTSEETAEMAIAIKESSSKKNVLSDFDKDDIIYDIASTGGIGNILPTLVALLVQSSLYDNINSNIYNAKIASTGGPGTIDTWLALPGFCAQFKSEILKKVGMCVSAQSEDLAIVDRYLMNARRAFSHTITDPSQSIMDVPSLVIASILGKRISISDPDNGIAPYIMVIVYSGKKSKFSVKEKVHENETETIQYTFFMNKVAAILKERGYLKDFRAIVVNNDIPHSNMIGRSFFLQKIIEVLRGEHTYDPYTALASHLAVYVLMDLQFVDNRNRGLDLIKESIKEKKALRLIKNIALSQGAHINYIENFIKKSFFFYNNPHLCYINIRAEELDKNNYFNNESIGFIVLREENISKLDRLFKDLATPLQKQSLNNENLDSIGYYHTGFYFISDSTGADMLIGRKIHKDTLLCQICLIKNKETNIKRNKIIATFKELFKITSNNENIKNPTKDLLNRVRYI